MLSEDLKKQIRTVNTATDVHELWDLLREVQDRVHRTECMTYYSGDKVIFNNRGIKSTGTVTKVNQKTISITLDNGARWKVTPSSLAKA